MENKKRFTKLKIAIGAALLCVLVVLYLNVGIASDIGGSGGCISIVFDKFSMLFADRAVICVGKERYEITDRDLIHQITKETMCAGNTDLCYPKNINRWIEIYRGDTLVRRMQWRDDDFEEMVIAYQADGLHWISPSYDGHGIVFISDELLAELNKVISTPPANL